jgi:hypothetical protein
MPYSKGFQFLKTQETKNLNLARKTDTVNRLGGTIRWLGRLYVPVLSVFLVLTVGNRIAVRSEQLTDDQVQSPEKATADDQAKVRSDKGNRAQLFYIGNSQTLTIVDRAPGDRTSPQWLQTFIAERMNSRLPKIEVTVGSLPGIDTAEILIRSVASRVSGQADILIVSIMLDEFRALGVRDDVAHLIDDPVIREQLDALIANNSDLPSGRRVLIDMLNSEKRADVESTGRNPDIFQRADYSGESWTRWIPVMLQRKEVRTQIGLEWTSTRNRILGIKSNSRRSVPDASFRASMELLELCLRYARSQNLPTVLYLAPKRSLEPNPFSTNDVARLRQEFTALCSRYTVACLDYMDLIPEPLWGNYSDNLVGLKGQPDFSHIGGQAQKIVAEHLWTDVGPQFQQWAKRREAMNP